MIRKSLVQENIRSAELKTKTDTTLPADGIRKCVEENQHNLAVNPPKREVANWVLITQDDGGAGISPTRVTKTKRRKQHDSAFIQYPNELSSFIHYKVGSFCWPAERARDGDVETILASSSVAPSHDSAVDELSASGGRGSTIVQPPMLLSSRSVKQHEHAAEAMVVSAAERRRQEHQEHRQPRGESTNPLPAGGHKSARSNHSGSSTQRSDSSHLVSSSSSTGSCNSSRLSTFRSSASSSSGKARSGDQSSSRSGGSGSSGRRTRRPTSYDATVRDATALTNNDPAQQQQQLSHRSAKSSARESRLRPPALLLGNRTPPPPSSSARLGTHHPLRPRALDPVFDRHHKYDLIAEEQAAKGGEVTGRFGEIHGSSVMAANLLTSELSTPWSHVLRGQKW